MMQTTRHYWRPLAFGTVLGLALMLVAEVVRVFVGPNFHVVVPQRCFRCGQPTPEGLKDLVGGLGIRTIVNLRGSQNPEEELWYQPEVDAAAALQVKLVDIGLSAYTPPPEPELCALIHALDTSAEPMLLHCHSGSDRTGLASAAYLLLKTNRSLEEARAQIHPRYGHNPWGGAACQQLVLQQYADWLQARGWQHTPPRFRHWACNDYRAMTPGA